MTASPLVMKFGGTSVGDADAIGRLLKHVSSRAAAQPVVVVVSALSGVTDRLLALASQAEAGNAQAIADGLAELRRRHTDVANGSPTRSSAAALKAIVGQLGELQGVLHAISTLRDASPRARDLIAATGEQMSSRIVVAALCDAGLPAAWIDPRRVIVTSDQFMQAVPIPSEIEAAAAREIAPVLASGKVAVVGGYVGATRQGVTTTLGRGGSDFSAALLGAALHASEIQIWTDVDGMLTADPRLVTATRVVPRLSFAEASELAYFGAKVLHPSTILPAVERNIPVRILNSLRFEGEGTVIAGAAAGGEAVVKAIACKRRITVVDITSLRMLMAHGFLRRVFEAFERHETAVDVVTTSEVSVSVTVDDDRRLDAVVAGLREIADVSVEPGMAILCAVGDGLRRDSRIALRMLGALEEYPLRMVSQAASRRNVTVVLRDADVPGAMARLHERFLSASGSAAAAAV
jgi:aspartate kinase